MKFFASYVSKDDKEQEFLQVSGKKVEIVSYLTTYLYKKSANQFHVVEEKSGLSIGRGITEPAAIKNARRRTRSRKKSAVMAMLNQQIQKTGSAPPVGKPNVE